MKVVHIITGLNNGGAEATLFRLTTTDTNNTHIVISMMDSGLYGPQLRENGIRIETLDMPRGNVSFSGIKKLYKLIKSLDPDVIQTWMYHADLIGGIVARIAGSNNIVWNLRHSNLDRNVNSTSTLVVARVCSLLSYILPRKIISCSHSSSSSHIAYGYAKKKIISIPNGYDLAKLKDNPVNGSFFRSTWNISNDQQLIAMIGRWDPQKDHRNLLKALALLQELKNNWKCMLIGPNMDSDNKELVELIKMHSLEEKILLVGPTKDICTVMSAIDIHILSSAGEAFPNVVAEAMACGTPCVVTNVGDAKFIVGDTGWVVPPKDPQLLANAVMDAIHCMQNEEQWVIQKRLCRERITGNFSIEKMVGSYNDVWSSAAKRGNS